MNITYGIIGLTSLVSLLAFNNADAMRRCIMNPYLVNTQRQYFRFITSGFVHQNFPHLLWNMLSLLFFGSVVEQTFSVIFEPFGTIYFIVFYLLGIIVSDIPSYFKHKNNPRYNALGASGGVSAIIFGSIVFQPLRSICIYFALCLPGFILGLLYLIGSYYQGKRANDNINHDAHLYGALFGVLFCAVLYPPSISGFIQQIMGWRFWE